MLMMLLGASAPRRKPQQWLRRQCSHCCGHRNKPPIESLCSTCKIQLFCVQTRRLAAAPQLLIMAAQPQSPPAKMHSGAFVALDKWGDLDKLLVVSWLLFLPSAFSPR